MYYLSTSVFPGLFSNFAHNIFISRRRPYYTTSGDPPLMRQLYTHMSQLR